MRLVSGRLTDYRMYVYGALAYLEKATPIVTMPNLRNHPFIGYVEATDMYRSFGRLHPVVIYGLPPRTSGRSGPLKPRLAKEAIRNKQGGAAPRYDPRAD